MNLLEKFEQKHTEKLLESKIIPDFRPGDTIRVNVKVVEGSRTRLQAFEGVCIARSGGSINKNFTVYKVAYGDVIERVFQLFSPLVESISVLRRGRVRRAKLYYLRHLSGKASRIEDRTNRMKLVNAENKKKS
jgi:large subunit ribosomal protein L19